MSQRQGTLFSGGLVAEKKCAWSFGGPQEAEWGHTEGSGVTDGESETQS